MRFKILPTVLAILFMTTGCSISFSGSGTSNNTNTTDGGLYKSTNKGNTWQQKVLIPNISGVPKSIAGIDVNNLAFDPSDNKAIYLSSVDNGLFYSYDATENWQIATALGKINVIISAVDPTSKCVIYATSGNKVYKSTDCNRSWEQIYFDNDLTVKIITVAIDYSNSTVVYIGTSRGEIIKSSDRGVSWQTLQRFNNSVEKIVISPFDNRVIFVATASKSLFRSTDGKNWISLADKLKDFSESSNFRDFAVAKSEKGLIILATRYGLLKSMDNGDSWKVIKLITPEKGAIIYSLAISPADAKEIYYATNTTFYRSLDGGENWTSMKLPSSRAGIKILIDPQDTSIIYLGVKRIK